MNPKPYPKKKYNLIAVNLNTLEERHYGEHETVSKAKKAAMDISSQKHLTWAKDIETGEHVSNIFIHYRTEFLIHGYLFIITKKDSVIDRFKPKEKT